MLKSSSCHTFLLCLNYSIIRSPYWNKVLRPKQVVSLEKLFLGRDVLAVLPTGYGKSLIYHVLPALFHWKKRLAAAATNPSLEVENTPLDSDEITAIVIIVWPLNSLIRDQIARLSSTGEEFGVRASVLTAKIVEDAEDEEQASCVFSSKQQRQKLDEGKYNLVFSHPESFVSCQYGRELLQSEVYKKNVCALVVDEAHCILEW